ncbi:MAG: hypothetical protein WKF65_09600 [Gaiellaceae bacterium]
MRRLVVILLFLLGVVTAAQAQPGTQSVLTAVSGQGIGRVNVSPTANDSAGTFDVQGVVNLHHALPNTTFTIARAVDLNPNGVCTSNTWNPVPETLTTSKGGAGAAHFEIVRGAPFTDGVRFDVRWRVMSHDGSQVLLSDCFTVTVK